MKEPLETRRSDATQKTPSVGGSPPSGAQARNQGPVLLAGSFEQIAKPVSGRVRVEQHGDLFELVVQNVTLNDPGPVHVYFVGLDKVSSTRDLDGVDAKYDFGPLEETGSGAFVSEQRIRLPSRPAPELRAVALINPRFGVVLASSSLESPQ